MPSRLARAAATVAVALCALAPAVAHAAGPPGYLFAAGGDPFVDGFAAGADGVLQPFARTATAAGSAGLASSLDGGSLYVVNQTDRTVSQYDIGDDGTLSGKAQPTVPTGGSPFGITVAPDGRHAYVADGDDDAVSIFAVGDDGALTPAGTVATGDFPLEVALSPDGASAYVTNAGAGTVSQFDVGADGGLTPKAGAPTVAAGQVPFGVTVSPNGDAVYVTDDVLAGTVVQFAVGAGGELTPMAPATVPAGASPIDVLATADGVYVANSGDDTISQYDAGAEGGLTSKAAAVASAAGPADLAVSADGASLYATGLTANAIAQFDVDAGGALAPKSPATVATGTGPIGLAFVVPADRSAPTVDLVTPADGATYTQDSSVLADYSCADTGGSDLASCDGDVADGEAIDTSTAGDHTFTVVARDGAGRETTVTHSYSVVAAAAGYEFQGFRVDPDKINDARAGRTLTIGFSLGGDYGLDVLAAGSPTSRQVSCSDSSRAIGEPTDAAGGLRFSSTSQNYRFDWSTSSRYAGTCRDFILTLSDGSEHHLLVRFRGDHVGRT